VLCRTNTCRLPSQSVGSYLQAGNRLGGKQWLASHIKSNQYKPPQHWIIDSGSTDGTATRRSSGLKVLKSSSESLSREQIKGITPHSDFDYVLYSDTNAIPSHPVIFREHGDSPLLDPQSQGFLWTQLPHLECLGNIGIPHHGTFNYPSGSHVKALEILDKYGTKNGVHIELFRRI